MSELLIDELTTLGESLVNMAVAYEAPQLLTGLEIIEKIATEFRAQLATKQLSPADQKRAIDLAFAAAMAAKWGTQKP